MPKAKLRTYQIHLHATRTGARLLTHQPHDAQGFDPKPVAPHPEMLHPQFVAESEADALSKLESWLAGTGYTALPESTTVSLVE